MSATTSPGTSGRTLQRVMTGRDGRPDLQPLYVRGGSASGERRSLAINPAGTAEFSTYFGAFPAHVWHDGTGLDEVVLTIEIDAPATVAIAGTDRGGRVTPLRTATGTPGVNRFAMPITADSGWLWFTVTAGAEPVTVIRAAWDDVTSPSDRTKVTVCITTFDRHDDCLRLLANLASDKEVLDRIDSVIVVDQGRHPLEDAQGLTSVAEALTGRLVIVSQLNLGGSGGYSRGMLMAERTASDAVVLMDDDIDLEPESLRRLIMLNECSSSATLIGAHMLDRHRPGVLHSWGEYVHRRSMWWGPVDRGLAGLDVRTRTPATEPGLSRPPAVDFNGWWMCLVPMIAVRTVGAALPLFIKWDDAEYGLRAGRAGFPTITLPGAAVWHPSWTEKDNALDWQAYFHCRNRLVTALLHGGRAFRVLGAMLMQDLKHLVCMEYGSVRVRQLALRDILSGPAHLPNTIHTRRTEVILSLERDGQMPVPGSNRDVPAPGEEATRTRSLWQILRAQWRTGEYSAASPTVAAGQGRWRALGSLGSAALKTADGTGVYILHRRPLHAATMLVDSIRLDVRLLLRWRSESRRYRRAAHALAGLDTWGPLFDRSSREE